MSEAIKENFEIILRTIMTAGIILIVGLVIDLRGDLQMFREEQVINTERIIRHEVEANRWKDQILENQKEIELLKLK